MTKRILYLTGAGASCNAVPLANQFKDVLGHFVSQVDDNLHVDDPVSKKAFLKDLQWLSVAANTHSSIDTFAKKLYLRNEQDEMRRLKASFSAFLLVRQATVPVDPRYDNLFANILKSDGQKLRIPSKYSFITWNYDVQIEKAFYGFCENSDQVLKDITRGPQVIRLNGIGGMDQTKEVSPQLVSLLSNQITEPYIAGFHLWLRYMSKQAASTTFAWEHDNEWDDYLQNALHDATTLIVIGYSFPDFNSSRDSMMLNAMPNLEKVYLQYPSGEHESIFFKINELRPNFLTPSYIPRTDTFYVPKESDHGNLT